MSWPKPRWRAGTAVSAAVFVLGLAIAAAASLWLRRDIDRQAEVDFQRNVERIAAEVSQSFRQPVYGLNGAKGVYAAVDRVTRAQFRAYVESRDLPREFPGVRGFGFIQRVLGADLDAFIAAERADDAPHFAVRQLADTGHEDLYVVKFVEPLASNFQALGFDAGSERLRREGAERAISTGEPTLSATMTLVQDERRGLGALLYVPVFRQGADPSTPAQRQRALVGLLYAPVVAAELLERVSRVAAGLVDFELLDSIEGASGEQAAAQLVFASRARIPGEAGGAGALPRDGRFQASRTVALPGRELTLRVRSAPQFDAALANSSPWMVFAGGALASALLALLLRQQVSGRHRAETLAQGMTADLDRLAQVAKHTTNGVWVTDSELRVIWINEGFTRLYGLVGGQTPEEVLGRTLADLFKMSGSRTAPAVYKTLADAITRRASCRVEIPYYTPDGHEYWIDAELQPLHDAQGNFTGYMEIASDITARKQAEAALHTMEAELRRKNDLLGSVLESLPCGLSVFDADLHLLAANAQFRRLLDLPDALFASEQTRFEDVIRFNAARGEYGAENVEAAVQEIMERARAPAVLHQFERVRPDGTSLEVRGGPLPGGGFVTTYTDISARRKAEAEARRDAELLRGAIDIIDEAFVLFDPQDRLVFCNDKYRRIYASAGDLLVPGASFEAILRQAAERGQFADAVGHIDEWVAHRMAAHRAGNTALVHRLDDGRSMRIVERRTADGHFVGFRVDITELVRATEAAQEARVAAEAATVAKSQFLANMSHEIRTPMNAILGMLALLRKTELTSRQADYASKTEGAARALMGLLNDILDFSKVEAGKMTLDPQPFRIDELLRELSVIVSANIGAKNVEVLFDIDPTLPRCLVGDALRLKQVLINLSGNAIKFTAEGEVVVSMAVVALDAAAVTVEIAVRDTGIGIAPENQARIFSGFTQAEASTTRRFGGTGLGVVISQRLVALMGGELELESALGEGSRFHFRITLPVAAASAEAAPAQPLPDAPLRALVVDDNPTAREILERMGSSLGWTIAVADSGEQALELLQARAAAGIPFQAVFVDWQMPGLDGWETSLRIRNMGPDGTPPIVVMVTAHGYEMLSERSESERSLLDGFLVKPVTASMLFDAVVDARCDRAHPHPSRFGSLPAGRRLVGMRLLVAEDNLNNQLVARELLEQEGAIVQLANHGQEAFDALAAGTSFDVVLMDLQMPVMDGFTATSRIRQDLGLLALPIVAMTANAMASDREACLAAGMNDHVGKPFELNHLVRVLRRHALWPETDDAEAVAAPALPAAVSAAAAAAGVDIAAALNRIGGDLGLYQRMLRLFVKDLAAMPARLCAHGEQGDAESAVRLLHSLKGVAATLSAGALSSEAARCEKHLASGPGPAEAGATVERACAAIAAAQPGLALLLQALQDAQAPAEAATGTLDAGAALEALRAMAEQLRNADMAATEAIVALQRQFGGVLGAQLQPIAEAVGELAFERALRLCDALIEGQAA